MASQQMTVSAATRSIVFINESGRETNIFFSGRPTPNPIPTGKSWICLCNRAIHRLIYRRGLRVWIEDGGVYLYPDPSHQLHVTRFKVIHISPTVRQDFAAMRPVGPQPLQIIPKIITEFGWRISGRPRPDHRFEPTCVCTFEILETNFMYRTLPEPTGGQRPVLAQADSEADHPPNTADTAGPLQPIHLDQRDPGRTGPGYLDVCNDANCDYDWCICRIGTPNSNSSSPLAAAEDDLTAISNFMSEIHAIIADNPDLRLSPADNPDPSSEPADNPDPSSEPADNPDPSSEPADNPDLRLNPAYNPDPRPEPADNPDPRPEPADNPDPRPEPADRPDLIPEPAARPDLIPEPAGNPDLSPEPVHRFRAVLILRRGRHSGPARENPVANPDPSANPAENPGNRN